MSYHFQFNFDRALQASACLLRLDNKRMSYLRLLKLLYIAEREWIAETGESITGDRAYALKNGPVLSSVYNLIKGDATQSGRWDDFIHKDGYQVTLIADPGRGELSKGMIDKLSDITARHREDDDWHIVDVSHTFPEWEKNRIGNSHPIPVEDILEAQGRSHMLRAVEKEGEARRIFDDVFGPEP